ncbi:hypothetical protein C4566_00600 [Candidatus Parcubacteria bacterium]|nr:MAG: hypothetical protein C4566_00600 [Candidatus Parcubacteria bacterium]
MKAIFDFHFYSRIAVLAIFVLAAWSWHQALESRADIPAANPPRENIKIGGWAWSEISGWVSLNCKNDVDGDGIIDDACNGTAGEWGLYTENDYVKGCGYSGTILTGSTPLGWICWSDPGGTLAPVAGVPVYDGSPVATEPRNNLNQSSYASILSFEGIASGSSELRFPIADASVGSGEIEGCFNCYRDPVFACDVGSGSCDCAPDIYGNVPDSCSDVANCPDYGDPPTPDVCKIAYYADKCDNCLDYTYYNGVCSDDPNRVCTTDDNCNTGEYCRNMSTCSENPDINCTDGIYACSGICVERQLGEFKEILSGWDCSTCTFEDVDGIVVNNKSCGVNAYGYNINSCATCSVYYNTPGVTLDNRHNKVLPESNPNNTCDPAETDPSESDFCLRGDLCGWAWNAWDAGNSGLGWFQFSPRITTTTKPYFSIEGGKIYSKKDIFNRYTPPFGQYNATYLIEAGGTITNLVSSSTLSGVYQGELGGRPIINFLAKTDTKYSNALGTIDYDGLVSVSEERGSDYYNKYGSLISTIETSEVENFESEFLVAANGKVVYVPAASLAGVGETLTINQDITFNKGDVAPSPVNRASAVIVIEGDLIIQNDINYEAGTGPAIENLKQIPSIVWIVKGSVLVMPNVQNLAGTFVILGKEGLQDCSAVSPDFSCGLFIASSNSNGTDPQLQVSGNVLARRFYLNRDYVANREPSEKFINDGRLQANPPLGLENLSKVIPRFSESPF